MTRLAQTYPQLARQLVDTGWSSTELASIRAAYDLAASLFVGAERGSGKPFIDHLVGSASGVLLGGGNADAVAAALLHAAYAQGDFGDGRSRTRDANRRRVRAAVGAAVENLAFAYDQLGWSPAVAATAVANVAAASAPERSVLLMRVANEVDDALDGELVLSGKQHLVEHTHVVHQSVVELAERIGTPELASMARDVLLTAPPRFPPELIVGAIDSRMRMPKSARPRLSVRAAHTGIAANRLLRRRLPLSARRFLRRLRRP